MSTGTSETVLPGAPRISVLVPAYNAERFLGDAIESVRAQTRRDWEVVVVDNASTDLTSHIAQEYARMDPRIRSYRNDTNVGPVLNWRRCAELARAPIAGLLFADDSYAPTFLERLTPWLDRPDVGFAYSAVRLGACTDPAMSAAYRLPWSGPLPVRAFLAPFYTETSYSVPSSPGCALFRTRDLRSALERASGMRGFRFLEHGAGPDARCYWEACDRYTAFVHESDALVMFRKHEGNLSWRPDVRAAYHRAWLDWIAQHPSDWVVPSYAKARAWVSLRGDPLRAAVVGSMGWRDYSRVPAAFARKALRLARSLRRGVRAR